MLMKALIFTAVLQFSVEAAPSYHDNAVKNQRDLADDFSKKDVLADDSQEFCEVDGKRHKVGQRFVDSICAAVCECTAPQSFSCVSLCPPKIQPPCKPGETEMNTVSFPFAGSNCTCPEIKCVKAFCEVDGNKHEVGQRFVDSMCASVCVCTAPPSFSCVSLCPPKIQPPCKPGETRVNTVSFPFAGSSCTCPEVKCVKAFCEVDGKKHEIGQKFVDSNCSALCRCTAPPLFSCVSLCPPKIQPPCTPGETRVNTVSFPFAGSSCTCPEVECV